MVSNGLVAVKMIVNMELINEYPFDGEFFEMVIDNSLPLLERKPVKKVLLTTKCDIQEAQKSESKGATNAKYNVYFPFNKDEGVSIRRGVSFKGSMYGIEVEGNVIGVFPTQLGGCSCYIGDSGV